MKNIFSKKWSLTDFTKFVTPSVLSIITISLYWTVDSIFIARFVGSDAIAAVNIIMPMLTICFGMGIMTAAGGSAIIGIELGKGNEEKASRLFSFTICFLLCVMFTIIMLSVFPGIEKISYFFGASKKLVPYCIDYFHFFIFGIAAIVFQVFFEYFIRLDGKPIWAFYLSIAGGLTNTILDYIFIVHLDMGIMGAGAASTAGIVSAVSIGIFYFLKKSNTIKFTKPLCDFKFLLSTILNGSSEMITEMSTGVKILAFNFIIVKYAQEAGIAAMAILMNLYFLFSAIHIGIIMGIAPVISFNHGYKNFKKIRETLKYTFYATIAASILAFSTAFFFGENIIRIYIHEPHVIDITTKGMIIFAFVYLINGFNIIASGFFTAVNNGKISALIAILNSFIFVIGFALILPPKLGINGVWMSVPFGEAATLIVSAYFFMKLKKIYITPDIAN